MADGIVVLSRDPFARVDHIRVCEESSKSCAWCGSRRKSGRLFYYGVWLDNGHTHLEGRGFCSKSCRDSYND